MFKRFWKRLENPIFTLTVYIAGAFVAAAFLLVGYSFAPYLAIQPLVTWLAISDVLEIPQKRIKGLRLLWIRWILAYAVLDLLMALSIFETQTLGKKGIEPMVIIIGGLIWMLSIDHFIWTKDPPRKRRRREVAAALKRRAEVFGWNS